MRFGRNLYFFQNGAAPTPQTASILDGQGHITAIHLQSGTVSDLHVPPPRVRVSLSDIMQRKFAWCLLHSLFVGAANVHTGTANTAVLQTRRHGLFAAEEASKPFSLVIQDNAIVRGEWRWRDTPVGVHPAGNLTFSYTPFRTPWLRIDDRAVSHAPEALPFMVHAIADVDDVVVVPLMSATYGNFVPYLKGQLSVPIDETHTCKWILWNKTDGESFVVDTGEVLNPMHIVRVRRRGRCIEIYASHVRNLTDVLSHPSLQKRPKLEFHKHIIDVRAKRFVGSRVFEDASGDFPNTVSDDVVLINALDLAAETQKISFFDTQSDRVVHTVELPADARDVLYHDGHLLFCTLSRFFVCDAITGAPMMELEIPKRASNFHAALIDLSS